jgi:hypothetical protein
MSQKTTVPATICIFPIASSYTRELDRPVCRLMLRSATFASSQGGRLSRWVRSTLVSKNAESTNSSRQTVRGALTVDIGSDTQLVKGLERIDTSGFLQDLLRSGESPWSPQTSLLANLSMALYAEWEIRFSIGEKCSQSQIT